jgi:3-oxoacyl-[acyl-carrier protein] reductase
MPSAPKLEGKVAVVTGSGRGVGRAIALKLASEGARLVLNDLDTEPAEDVARAVEALGGEAVVCAGDVTTPDFGDRLVTTAIDQLGRLDVIINNAGYIWNTTIQNHTDEQWYAMMDVHATAPFRILRAAAPYLREAARREQAEGSVACRKVVNVSSISGVYGAATQLSYSAAKAAAIGITKTLAKEWGRYNVTVNCVALGHIDTRLTERLTTEAKAIQVKGRELKVGVPSDALDMMHALTPLGRGGTPEDAAGAVYLFCIPESDYVSGQVLICSGGLIF